jgi:hypothetical protein
MRFRLLLGVYGKTAVVGGEGTTPTIDIRAFSMGHWAPAEFDARVRSGSTRSGQGYTPVATCPTQTIPTLLLLGMTRVQGDGGGVTGQRGLGVIGYHATVPPGKRRWH